MIKKIAIACLFTMTLLSAYAQNKSLSVGVKILNEFDIGGGTLYPGVGGQLVYRMTKHSGLESGLYYSNQSVSYYFYTNGPCSYNVDIAERWLVLPLLYRFDSKIVNFIIGPQIDYFLGWRNQASRPSVIVNNYSRPSARLVLTAGFSKSIMLSSKWTLEPEARLSFFASEENGTIGLNLALRRKLF